MKEETNDQQRPIKNKKKRRKKHIIFILQEYEPKMRYINLIQALFLPIPLFILLFLKVTYFRNQYYVI